MNSSITYVFMVVTFLTALLALVTAGLMSVALRLSKPRQDEQSHENMAHELQRLKLAVHNVSDAVVVTGPYGHIEFVNPAFEHFTGYSMDAVLGLHYPGFVADHHGKTMCETLPDHMFQKRQWTGAFTQKNKHGNDVEGRILISPVKGESGEIINYVVVKQDLTEQKKLESIAEAENLMNNSGYIFSSIRHEIANPLNSLKMTLAVLEKNSRSFSRGTISEFTSRALAEVSRIEYLFEMFKSYNSYEKPNGTPARIDRFIERFTCLVEGDFADKGIDIKKEIPPGEHWACTDIRAMHQIMLNLFTNAADAVAGVDSPEIRVVLKPMASCMDISIEDNGCGMTDGEMRTVFQPFCTSKPKGTGIGLAIVKRMLSELNSGILIKSEKNRGTTVSVHLPLCTPSAQRDAEHENPASLHH